MSISDLLPYVGPIDQLVDDAGTPMRGGCPVRMDTYLIAGWPLLGIQARRLLRLRSLPVVAIVEPAGVVSADELRIACELAH